MEEDANPIRNSAAASFVGSLSDPSMKSTRARARGNLRHIITNGSACARAYFVVRNYRPISWLSQ